MRRHIIHRVSFLAALSSFVVCNAVAFQIIHREIDRTRERSLRAVIDVSFGDISLQHGSKDKILALDFEDDTDQGQRLQVDYDIRGDEGILRIRVKKSSHMWGDEDSDDGHRRKLTVWLTNDVPMALDIELGAGEGDIDLTDLQLEDLKISTGASSVDVQCDKLNPISADEVNIESGVSKFTAMDLSNTNFKNLKFSGGVGSYKLDFGGELQHDATAKIEVGLGSVSVSVPKEIAAKLLYDASFFSSFDLDDDFVKVKSGVYETENAGDSEGKLTIQIEAGLGSVKVKRK
jgi:DUF4097 and DUF4098 domain-containing protein YvlB